MLYALGWSAVFVLLALWSLASWAFHSAATWTLANAGDLAGGLSTAIWVGWGLGAALLIVAGLAGHWLITMLGNRGPGFSLPR